VQPVGVRRVLRQAHEAQLMFQRLPRWTSTTELYAAACSRDWCGQRASNRRACVPPPLKTIRTAGFTSHFPIRFCTDFSSGFQQQPNDLRRIELQVEAPLQHDQPRLLDDRRDVGHTTWRGISPPRVQSWTAALT